MSAIPGFVTRKDGRITEMPERARKTFRILAIMTFVVPAIMLLTGLGSPKGVMAWWVGLILSIIPVGVVLVGMVSVLRTGMKGNVAYGFGLVVLNYLAMTFEPHTELWHEMLLIRTLPMIGCVVILWYLWQDLHYNLRDLWYSVDAMMKLSQQMAELKARRSGQPVPGAAGTQAGGKVIDADAIIRAYQEQTGVEVPRNIASGLTVRPGFRQESRGRRGSADPGGKQRKRRNDA